MSTTDTPSSDSVSDSSSGSSSRREQRPGPLLFVQPQTAEFVLEDGSVRRSHTDLRDPFATPTGTQRDPFSPTGSVVSFQSPTGGERSGLSSSSNLERDAAYTGILMKQRHNINVTSMSTTASRVGLSSPSNPSFPRTNSALRESFAAPPTLVHRVSTYAGVSPSDKDPRRMSMKPKASDPRTRSTLMDGEIDKPWIHKKDGLVRLSWWLTTSMVFLGVAASCVYIYFGWRNVPRLGNICLVMEDNFDGPEIDTSIWQYEVDLGGYGNGEFEMTTTSPNNSFIRDGSLYIVPTLTADVIGQANVLGGYTYNLTGCTNANVSACGAVSNISTKAIIPPIQSARLTTRLSHSIQYGRVEIRAKLPSGDWIWPALWMLPLDSVYGPWPLSGEIDIMEARGNDMNYPQQGVNYVRSSLNWGPLTWLNEVSKTFGWWMQRRASYDQAYHTYALEWSPTFLRSYVDTRLDHMLQISFDEPFFSRGDFPPTVFNGSQEINVPNPWEGSDNSAPFNKPFYLILDVAVGGTSGWFPDGYGSKPWLDGSLTAMYDFYSAQKQWWPTWPEDVTQRGMAIDYVKMWQSC